jgi:hypothetical protein
MERVAFRSSRVNNAHAPFITEVNNTSSYFAEHYMKTHIYDEDTFDRYIEMGDVSKTYEADDYEFDLQESSTNEFSDNIADSPISEGTIPMISEETQATAMAILDRLSLSIQNSSDSLRGQANVQIDANLDIVPRSGMVQSAEIIVEWIINNANSSTYDRARDLLQSTAFENYSRQNNEASNQDSEEEIDDDIIVNSSSDDDYDNEADEYDSVS